MIFHESTMPKWRISHKNRDQPPPGLATVAD